MSVGYKNTWYGFKARNRPIIGTIIFLGDSEVPWAYIIGKTKNEGNKHIINFMAPRMFIQNSKGRRNLVERVTIPSKHLGKVGGEGDHWYTFLDRNGNQKFLNHEVNTLRQELQEAQREVARAKSQAHMSEKKAEETRKRKYESLDDAVGVVERLQKIGEEKPEDKFK